MFRNGYRPCLFESFCWLVKFVVIPPYPRLCKPCSRHGGTGVGSHSSARELEDRNRNSFVFFAPDTKTTQAHPLSGPPRRGAPFCCDSLIHSFRSLCLLLLLGFGGEQVQVRVEPAVLQRGRYSVPGERRPGRGMHAEMNYTSENFILPSYSAVVNPLNCQTPPNSHRTRYFKLFMLLSPLPFTNQRARGTSEPPEAVIHVEREKVVRV